VLRFFDGIDEGVWIKYRHVYKAQKKGISKTTPIRSLVLEIAARKERLFSEDEVVAIHQGSGGLLRRANILARGSLACAASENCPQVSSEHVRVSSTEII